LHHRGSGEGPALLLVHGFGGNCEHWRRNLPELGGFTDTYAIDLLGTWRHVVIARGML
jgi:pimeloyl-ACP methyl ester carboxylesterase